MGRTRRGVEKVESSLTRAGSPHRGQVSVSLRPDRLTLSNRKPHLPHLYSNKGILHCSLRLQLPITSRAANQLTDGAFLSAGQSGICPSVTRQGKRYSESLLPRHTRPALGAFLYVAGDSSDVRDRGPTAGAHAAAAWAAPWLVTAHSAPATANSHSPSGSGTFAPRSGSVSQRHCHSFPPEAEFAPSISLVFSHREATALEASPP